MTTTTPTMTLAVAPLRRNIGFLALAQALFQSVQGMAIATTPLAALAILGGGTAMARDPAVPMARARA